MIAADGLLKSLSADEQESYMNYNDDVDFGKVLDFYETDGEKTHGELIRYADGSERVFSFDS